jgi:hypothetical protein
VALNLIPDSYFITVIPNLSLINIKHPFVF